MEYPRDWEESIGSVEEDQYVSPSQDDIGHQEQGRTVVLHSVAIAPGFQGRGMGGVLMKSYISSIAGAGVADRLALLAHEVRIIVPRFSFASWEIFEISRVGMSHARRHTTLRIVISFGGLLDLFRVRRQLT